VPLTRALRRWGQAAAEVADALDALADDDGDGAELAAILAGLAAAGSTEAGGDRWQPATFYVELAVTAESLRKAAAAGTLRTRPRPPATPGARAGRKLYWLPDARCLWPHRLTHAKVRAALADGEAE